MIECLIVIVAALIVNRDFSRGILKTPPGDEDLCPHKAAT
jgi:hypothetical protein